MAPPIVVFLTYIVICSLPGNFRKWAAYAPALVLIASARCCGTDTSTCSISWLVTTTPRIATKTSVLYLILILWTLWNYGDVSTAKFSKNCAPFYLESPFILFKLHSPSQNSSAIAAAYSLKFFLKNESGSAKCMYSFRSVTYLPPAQLVWTNANLHFYFTAYPWKRNALSKTCFPLHSSIWSLQYLMYSFISSFFFLL